MDENENVKVAVRVRPLDEKELRTGCQTITEVETLSRSITVKKPGNHNEPPKLYTFDYVFDTDATQLNIYSEMVRPIVDNVIEGFNGSILAYGQTGTGKTFTMSGDPHMPELRGIIPNSFAHIFGHISKSKEETQFLVCVTYIEIYNEEVRDLISNTKNLEVRERPGIGVYVEGLTGCVCKNADEIDRILRLGSENRTTGATALNEQSSRSHAILTITVETSLKSLGSEKITQGKLCLVDLAGSERQNKTQATGKRLKEASKINYSLSVLGNVISALSDSKSTHIPYRNSKLTRLLKDSLGGNSKTVMIANIGPADSNYEETISTLRYASRAKYITNHARANENPKDAMLRSLQEEIEKLRKKLHGTYYEEEETEEFCSGIYEKSNIENNEDEENEDQRMEPENQLSNPKLELHRTIHEQSILKGRLENLEQNILFGGENLLETADLQQKLLDASVLELEKTRQKTEILMQHIKDMEAERLDIEERYSSLNEEALGKTKKLNKIITALKAARAELEDMHQEHQRVQEGGLENARALTRELQLVEAVLNLYIPIDYSTVIEKHAHYNEDIGEWQLKCVAYTGNNMRKEDERSVGGSKFVKPLPPFPNVYTSYGRSKHGTARQGRSNVPRPSTSKAKW